MSIKLEWCSSQDLANVAAFAAAKSTYAKVGEQVSDAVVASLRLVGYEFKGYTDKGTPSVGKGNAEYPIGSFVYALHAACKADPDLKSRVYGVRIQCSDGHERHAGQIIDAKVGGATRWVPIGGND
jgi:hypothetical protein